MTDCSRADVRDLLPDLLHERLDPVTRAEVERHVSACADCAAEMRLLRGMRAALARTPVVNVQAIAERIRASGGEAREVA
ncbi:MAG: anti-sigma factor family protein, partial [Gemmatimonadaceae bacterium]